MSGERRKKSEKRFRGLEDVVGVVQPPKKPERIPLERKKSPDGKEATTGILRVDCSKPRRSSGGSVDFRGVPDRLTTQGEPPSPQPSVDRLSVTFAEKSDCSDSSVKVNIFDPGSPPSKIQEMDKVRFCNDHTDGEEEDEDDYSASVSVIMQRRESMKRVSSKKRKRRPSSPLLDGDAGLLDSRRRSSEYTNSSGDTAISMENGSTTQEQIFENIRLHKEVLSNVKLQPWGMRRKIKLVQQAKAYVKRHEGELEERLAMSKSTKDILARFNIWLIKKLQFLKRELANMMTLLVPWELRIKEIESHFGSAVASYFTFLRWMFWVNLVITIILACFVAIPEMLTADVKSAGERKVLLPEEELSVTNLVTLWDFEGVLKYSPIFYGYYTNRDGSGTGYRLPFAYFMTGLAVYVYSFVATLRRMAENSRMSKLSEKDDECIFTWKIFTGWDYMIGNAETAHNRVASLILGFKEALLEETERKKDEKNWKVICLRVLVSFTVIGLLGFSAYIVFIVVERSTQTEAKDTWWRQNETTVSVSIISMLFPYIFDLLGMLEGYHPRKSLRIQLARIMVLNLLNLYTLIFSTFWKISDMTIELQSLKKNFSSMILPAIAVIPETVTPSCVLVPVNCSSSESLTTLPTSYPTADNYSTSGVFEVFENLTTSLEGMNFTLGNLSDWFNVSGLDDLLLSGSVPTNSSPIDDTSTESSDSSDSSSTIPYLFTVLAEIFRKTIVPVKNVTQSPETLSNSTELFLDDVFALGIGSKWENTSGANLRTSEMFETTSTMKEEDSSQPEVCFVRKCEEVRSETQGAGLVYDMETRRRLRSLCWETMFGQELVKLTIMDLMMTIVTVLLMDFFRAIFVKFMNNCWCWDLEKKFPQYGDFKIAENILHLVYNQGMVWMGMFFSPGLPAINLIKLVIMMYLRSWAVLTCNVPHEVVFRASRSNNFYLALLLTMLFLCVLPVGFAIVWIEPSWHCGPFSNYERIYHLFTQTLLRVLPKTLHKAVDYIASPGIVIPLLMLLVLIIYYLVSLTNSLREANNDLKVQLRRERTEERRKMFQMVNKRARKGSKDSETPFAKWKKLLPELAAKQITLANDVEKGEKNENEVSADLKKEINRKELLARLMKKALRKSSGTSDEDIQLTDDPPDGDQQDSLFEEKESKLKTESKKLEKKRESAAKPKPDSIKHKPKTSKPRHGSVSKSIKPGEKEKSKTGQTSPQRGSLPENIPVIKISKIESDEQLLKEDNGAKRGKERFRAVVEKWLALKRKEKERMKKEGDKKRKCIADEKKDQKQSEEMEKRCPIAVDEVLSSELGMEEGE